MENAPSETGADRGVLADIPVCSYCGEDEGQEMILALWMGGEMNDPPKWFHVKCLIDEASHWRDKRVVVDIGYPH